MGRLNSTRLVLLHFPDPVVFVRHFQVVHFQRHPFSHFLNRVSVPRGRLR